MASIKVKFRPSTVAGHTGIICYQIIHDRKVRLLSTDYRIYPDEWDKKRSMVTVGSQPERHPVVISLRDLIRHDIERLAYIDSKLDSDHLSYTVEDIVDEYSRYQHEYTFFNFMESIISKLKINDKMRTAETYRAALNSFKNFLRSSPARQTVLFHGDIMLDNVSPEIMESYQAWHQKRGIVPNTISFYMRVLRAVYNRAVAENLIKDRRPFRHVYTGVDRTVKRALPLVVIRKIKGLYLGMSPSLEYARDMFLMSFYLRGMSFIDMAFLKKSDLKNGYISYRRRKTGQQLVIKWTIEMQQILDKYPVNGGPYLLPVIKPSSAGKERVAYRNVSYKINRSLNKIAAMLNLGVPLTLYVARHSWASVARAKGVPVSVISEGMGHDSEATTRIYLASLDSSVVDKANSMIISLL